MDRDTSRRRRGIRRDRLASVVLGLGKKSIESVAASSPTWETLEVFARQSMQQLRQRMLKEEVDGVLGRARYERRDAVDAVAGYRNGFGKPRRLSLSSGTIALRAPAGARAERALRE